MDHQSSNYRERWTSLWSITDFKACPDQLLYWPASLCISSDQCCWSPCIATTFTCLFHLKHCTLRYFGDILRYLERHHRPEPNCFESMCNFHFLFKQAQHNNTFFSYTLCNFAIETLFILCMCNHVSLIYKICNLVFVYFVVIA